MTKQFESILSSFSTIEEVKAFIKGYQLREDEQTTKPEKTQSPSPADRIGYLNPNLWGTSRPAEMVSTPTESPAPETPKRKSSFGLRGLRAQTLRLLYTGPCTIHSLGTALQVTGTPLTRVICQLRNQALAWHPKPNVVSLSPAGIAEAKYFVDNPNLKVRHKEKE